MKIRTRLAIAFVTITVVPIVLIFVAAFGLVNYQEHLFQKTYGLSEQIDLLSGNQTQVFNRLTQGIQEEIREAVGENTDLFEEPAYLSKVNEELRDKYSYLVIRKGKDITFCGSEDGRELCERLAPYGDQGSMAGSIYMDGEEQHLVKQIDFRFSDDSQGSVFIVTNVGDYVPEIKALLGEMLLLGVLIIVLCCVRCTSCRRRPSRSGMEIWTLRSMWMMKMRSECSARISRRCVCVSRNRRKKNSSTTRRAKS